MSSLPSNQRSPATVDAVGRQLAQPLARSGEQVAPEVQARLSSARARAVARAQEVRQTQEAIASIGGGQAALSGGPAGRGKRWGVALLPFLLVTLGLVALVQAQWVQEALGLGDVDTALLKDALPPNAYGDPGFNEYLDEEDPKGRSSESHPEAEQKDEGA